MFYVIRKTLWEWVSVRLFCHGNKLFYRSVESRKDSVKQDSLFESDGSISRKKFLLFWIPCNLGMIQD